MTEPLPKWIQTRYAKLWNKFKEKGFTLDEAEKVLKNNKGINVFFSDLRKSGWIEVTLRILCQNHRPLWYIPNYCRKVTFCARGTF